jgi:hypothetical protein
MLKQVQHDEIVCHSELVSESHVFNIKTLIAFLLVIHTPPISIYPLLFPLDGGIPLIRLTLLSLRYLH